MKYEKYWFFFFPGVMLSFVGSIFMLVSLFTLVDYYSFKKDSEQITAVISDIQERVEYSDGERKIRHDVYVDYFYDGNIYEHVDYNFYSSGMRVGDQIQVLVNKKRPGVAKSPYGNAVSIFMWVLGIILATVGGVTIGILIKREKNRKNLAQNGLIITATITRVSRTIPLKSNRKTMYIDASYIDPATCIEYKFESPAIYDYENTLWEQCKEGDLINIFVEPGNYKNYCFDFGAA